jgi:hypothetical protein
MSYVSKKNFEKNLDKIDWSVLSTNTNAIQLIKKKIINWHELSANSKAIKTLENKKSSPKKSSVTKTVSRKPSAKSLSANKPKVHYQIRAINRTI